jgi:hypothetical protein
MIQAYLIRAFIALALLSAACVASCRHGQSMKQGEWDAAKLSEAEAVKRADESVAKRIAQIRIEHVEITKPIVKTVREVPVYRDCVHPDRVRDGIDKALIGAQ